MEAVGDFQNAIQRELAWRKREISALKTLAFQAEETANHVFRGCQVLLCAHWEGFLKTSATLYLDHVFSQNITVRELKSTFVAVAFFGKVMKAANAKYPGSEEHHVQLAADILAGFDARVTKPGWNVDTEGNPGSDVVERVLKSIGVHPQLGMDNAAWTTTKVFINDHLVKDRNSVAHGEGLPLDRTSLLNRSQRLLELLDRLSDQLMTDAQRRAYLSATQADSGAP
jgi:MAE_28990/MAE_18760-like HEPN